MLNMSSDGKKRIINIMNQTQSHPRHSRKDNGPVVEKLDVSIAKRARFLGIGGYNLKKILAETGSSNF